MRLVDRAEWDLSLIEDRMRVARLSDPPSPEQVLSTVLKEANDNAAAGQSTFTWEDGEQMFGCGRAIAVFPLSRDSFDVLFNGRSGYRAQYYLSCAEGAQFNRLLVDTLVEAVRHLHRLRPPQKNWDLVLHSLRGPWSKIGVHGDSAPFKAATAAGWLLGPRKWVESSPASIWLSAPLPDQAAIDLKGSWVSDADGDYRQDPSKQDRDQCLSDRGFA